MRIFRAVHNLKRIQGVRKQFELSKFSSYHTKKKIGLSK